MRIAIVTPFSRGMGGVEVFSRLLSTILLGAGHSVEFVTSEGISEENPLDRMGRRLFGAPWLTRKAFLGREGEFDLVLANGEFAWGIRHPRTVQIFHGCYRGFLQHLWPSISWRQRFNLDRLARIQKAASKGKRVVAVSRFVAEILGRDGVVVDKVIPNAVDTSRFLPRGSPEFSGKFVFVATYNRFGKGFDVLEELAARGLEIDCVTDRPPGPGLGWIRQIPHDELPDLLPRYGGFLFPSRFEGMALAPLEAMACGLPVLSSQVGFGQELMEEIPEMVFDWRRSPTIDEIEKKAKLLLERREGMSVRARDFVEAGYGLETFRKRWCRFVEVAGAGGGADVGE